MPQKNSLKNRFPKIFEERIKQILPESEIEDFFNRVLDPLPKVVRISQENFKKPQHWDLKKTAIKEAFFIERENQKELPLGKTLEHFTGEIYVQSLSSMLPVEILDVQVGDKILDMCAAPGSKSTFLSQKMKQTGALIANELSGTRSKKLVANLQRMGVLNAVVLQSDGSALSAFLGQEFDKILLDAPCSSEGFSRKDSKFFEKMWSEQKIFQAAKLQKKLIISAFKMLKPEGEMIYSTCTSAPEENELVVQYLLDEFPDEVEILDIDVKNIPHKQGILHWDNRDIDSEIYEKCIRLYPHLRSEFWDSESFFVVKIRKKYALNITPPKKPNSTPEFKVLKKNHTAEIRVHLAKRFGLPKDWMNLNKDLEEGDYKRLGIEKKVFFERFGDIYIATPEAVGFGKNNLYRRLGVKILDKDKNITHEFASIWGNLATKNVIELDEAQKEKWLLGYDLPLSEMGELKVKDIVIIRYKGFVLGWAKILPNKIKNKLDRNLVF